MAKQTKTAKKPSGPMVKPDLPAYLAQAVPGLAADLHGFTFEQRQAIVHTYQSHGDNLGIFSESLVTGDTQPVIDELLPELATLVAIFSLVPGGVEVFGQHFDFSDTEEKEAAHASTER